MSNTKQQLINLLGKNSIYHKYDDKALGTRAEEFFKANEYKNLEFVLFLEEDTKSILDNCDYNNCYWGSEAFHKIITKANLHFEWYDSCIGHLYLEKPEEDEDEEEEEDRVVHRLEHFLRIVKGDANAGYNEEFKRLKKWIEDSKETNKQFKNLITLIKGCNTIEKLNMLKELPILN